MCIRDSSLSAQVSFFNDYISKVPNWQFIGSYIDEGISGTSVKLSLIHIYNELYLEILISY